MSLNDLRYSFYLSQGIPPSTLNDMEIEWLKSGGTEQKLRGYVYIEDFFDASSDINAAPAIIAALTSLTRGQTLSSFTGTVQLTEVVDYSFTSDQESCAVELNSTFITQNDNGFKLDGLGIELRHINIGIIAYKSTSINDSVGTNVSVGVGLELRNFWNTTIDTLSIVNFMTSQKNVGGGYATAANGLALCKITLRYPKAPKISGALCMENTTEPFSNTPGYFNSNVISVGFLRGQNGIKFTKGALQSDPFNGNKVVNTSIEDTVDTGIELQFSSGNIIEYPRFEGGNVPNVWVTDDAESSRNKVKISGAVNTTKILLNGSGSEIDGTATIAGGLNIYSHTLIGSDESDPTGNNQTIYLANRINTGTKNNTIAFGGLSGQDRFSKYAGAIVDMNGDQKPFGLLSPVGYNKQTNVEGVVQVPNGISHLEISTTGASEVFLTMSADREINGFSMTMDLTFFSLPISVRKSNGTETINNTVITATGLYLLVYKADQWFVTKLADKLQG